jgi:hypothetical protein
MSGLKLALKCTRTTSASFENRATAFRSSVTSGCDDWLGVRDDFRNWLQLGLKARERT